MMKQKLLHNANLVLAATLTIAVIVTFILWEQPLTYFVDDWLASTDLSSSKIILVVIALLTLDVLLPIPSSIISVAAGSLLSALAGFIGIFLGMFLGCLFGYGLGRLLGKAGIGKLVEPEQQQQANQKLFSAQARYLMACRGVPVLAEVSILMAGVNRVPVKTFLVTTSIANALIALAYILAGQLIQHANSIFTAVIVVLAMPALLTVLHRIYYRNC